VECSCKRHMPSMPSLASPLKCCVRYDAVGVVRCMVRSGDRPYTNELRLPSSTPGTPQASDLLLEHGVACSSPERVSSASPPSTLPLGGQLTSRLLPRQMGVPLPMMTWRIHPSTESTEKIRGRHPSFTRLRHGIFHDMAYTDKRTCQLATPTESCM
jgi:hypothetical protein